MSDLTWDELDRLVDSDPLALRDRAWAEITRLRSVADAAHALVATAETHGALRWADAANLRVALNALDGKPA